MTDRAGGLAQLPLAGQLSRDTELNPLCCAVFRAAAVSGRCLRLSAMATRCRIDADQLAAPRGLQQ
jgi:hypothetical protein